MTKKQELHLTNQATNQQTTPTHHSHPSFPGGRCRFFRRSPSVPCAAIGGFFIGKRWGKIIQNS